MKRRVFLASALTLPLLATFAGSAFAADGLTVLLPPWGTLPKEMTDRFAKDAGVTLDAQTLGWDDIRTKIITSMVAGTAPADATEVDWSWVGQFGSAGWYAPLDDKIDKAVIADIPTASIFRYDGKLLAVPYSNDFRILIYNKAHLEKAGIKAAPTTPDEMLAAAKAVKSAGIADYPIGLPLSATEGTSTAWYLLTKAFGGDLFDKDFKPLFTDKDSGGYKALAFEIGALKDGLIDPAATGLKDVEVQEVFKAGKLTFDVAGWAGNLSVYSDPAKSQVANDVAAALMPSATGKSRTFGLPEAVGIPTGAANAKAAQDFITWMAMPQNQIAAYEALGNLPPRMSVLRTLNEQGKLKQGDVLLEQAALVEPLITQGTPGWYPQFSTAVASAINQAAKGQLSVDDAIAAIAKAAEEAQAN
ncbi:ABC transporter substrate-binding protein [Pleomorphomonas diazotrophica]|uniref:ABC transporter substrate-binding protein n=1 Tax=Pleomorphomonas diazotrophica TaxID=1166257 RepID=A0A1I4S3U4_9HYPH|nr:extracellular solute-binding protein [Pleomorphomonas diazotrophica]PKR89979.1 ABC transporter substrate-binding protein [Pleomorphomonas diazotrophica]SFM59129.1 carbohydrate ABC transporter substrate-binding protein, CUT1 family [Pleomorphomonas diazotrophica]